VFKWPAAASAIAVVLPLALVLLVTADPTSSVAGTNVAGGPSVLAMSDIPPERPRQVRANRGLLPPAQPRLSFGSVAIAIANDRLWWITMDITSQVMHATVLAARLGGWLRDEEAKLGDPRCRVGPYRTGGVAVRHRWRTRRGLGACDPRG